MVNFSRVISKSMLENMFPRNIFTRTSYNRISVILAIFFYIFFLLAMHMQKWLPSPEDPLVRYSAYFSVPLFLIVLYFASYKRIFPQRLGDCLLILLSMSLLIIGNALIGERIGINGPFFAGFVFLIPLYLLLLDYFLPIFIAVVTSLLLISEFLIVWGLHPSFPALVDVFFKIAALFTITLIGSTLAKRTLPEYEAALKERISELEASRRRIVLAQETVRQKLASQLHGPVQTKLLILRKTLDECQGMIKSQPDRATGMLSQVSQELDSLQKEELRGITHELHPSVIRVGLPAAIRSICDRFETLIPIMLQVDEKIDRLEDPTNPLIPEDIALALYRLVEEGLNNVVKHAEASQVIVYLWQPNPGQIGLSVEDDGVGFLVGTYGHGLGILTMQDYIGALGGTFDIQSTLGKGTQIVATVTIKATGSRGIH